MDSILTRLNLIIAELPDSYYNPTAGELRAAHSGQTNRLKSLGVDTNFSTKVQRDKEAREKETKRINRYPKVSNLLTPTGPFNLWSNMWSSCRPLFEYDLQIDTR